MRPRKFIQSGRPNRIYGARTYEPARKAGFVARIAKNIDQLFEPTRKVIERSALVHVAAIFLAFFTFAQLSIDLFDRQSERAERSAAAIDRAWSHLMMPMGGFAGKGRSLDLLASADEDLTGVILNCETVGTWKNSKCVRGPYFSDFSLHYGGDKVFRFNTPSFQQAIIENADLSHGRFNDGGLEDAVIETVDLSFAQIGQSKARMRWVDLTNASMGFGDKYSIRYANISGLDVMAWVTATSSYPKRAEMAKTFQDAWFWSDNPPVMRVIDNERSTWTYFLLALPDVKICDARFRGPRLAGLWSQWRTYWFPPRRWQPLYFPTLLKDKTVPGSRFYRTEGRTYVLKDQKLAEDRCPTVTLEEAVKLHPEKYDYPKVH